MQNNPLVSIIIPTYNRAHLIGETLDSVLAQTYPNWECIVVDDGSTDNTAQVLEQYVEQDNRFKFYKRPDSLPKGANACRNFGFEISKGDYINWFDSDDLMSQNKLEYQISALSQQDYEVLICQWLFFSDNINIDYSKSFSFVDFNTGIELLNYLGEKSTYIPIHVYLIKSEIIRKVGLWNETLKINQDGEFMVRVLLQVNNVKFVSNSYALYRRSTNDNTSSYRKDRLDDLIKSWKLIAKHCKGYVKGNKNIYVLNSKKRLFSNLKYEHQYFIMRNFFFFREIIIKEFVKKIKKYFYL